MGAELPKAQGIWVHVDPLWIQINPDGKHRCMVLEPNGTEFRDELTEYEFQAAAVALDVVRDGLEASRARVNSIRNTARGITYVGDVCGN